MKLDLWKQRVSNGMTRKCHCIECEPWRHNTQEEHIMGSVANAALARAAELKKNPKAKTTTKAKTAPKPRLVKSDVPWKRIAALYEQGKSTAEISDALELTRPKTKEGKENPYPYYLTVGYLTRLSHGVKVGDDTIKIKRGTGSRKKK